MSIKIDNTPEEAIQDGKWSNPGASFYNTLIKEENASELIDEAYLIHGDIATKWHSTPFSRSGCKYPHHSIKDGKLVISIPGLKAAYNRACQMGVFNGDLKKHIEMHAKQLGIANQFHYNETMDQNFYDIEKYIMENTDYDLSNDLAYYESKLELFDEKSHGRLKFDFRFARNVANNKLIKIIYDLNPNMKEDPNKPDNHTKFTFGDKKANYHDISRYGNKDHSTNGQKVLAIIEYDDESDVNNSSKGRRLNEVTCYGVFGFSKTKFHIKVGEIDNSYSYKSTHIPKKHETMNNYITSIISDHEKSPINRGTLADNANAELIKKTNKAWRSLNPNIKEAIQIIGEMREKSPNLDKMLRMNNSQLYKIAFIEKGINLISNLYRLSPADVNILAEFHKAISDLRWFERTAKYYCKIYSEALKVKEINLSISLGVYKLLDCRKDKSIANITDKLYNLLIKVYPSFKMESVDYTELSDSIEEFDEASHGKLKFDFRLGWDAKTGHQIKVVYSLNNINVTDVGNFYYDYSGKKDGATHDSHLDYTRKNITKKGNTDHQSTGQKVLAIIDMVTKSKLQEVDLLNPFCDYIDTHMLVQPKENLKKANQYALSNPDSKSHLQVGKIDNTKSFKSTTWSKARTTDSNGEDFRFQGIASAEELKHGRGWKVHNIIPERFKLLRQNDGGFVFKENPTKEEAITELKVRHEHNMRIIKDLYAQLHAGANNPNIQSVINELNNMNNEIVSDYNTIKSGSYNVTMMKKYRTKRWDLSFKESYINSLSDSMPSSHEIIELNESLDTVKTPADFLLFMNDIEYGWVDKEGNRYEDADDGDFFKDYRLQSPKHLLESKLGVCWDQVELERQWFTNNGYKFRTFFIAIDDGEGKPSHTFLIYQEGNKVYWFENSWYDQRGIHKFNTINDAIKDIFDKFNKSKDNTEYPIYLYELPKMPEGITCKDYYIQATDSKNLIQKIEMNEITEAAEDSDISDPWFIRSDDGVDNCCIKVKGYDKPMRGRSAMITLKLDEDDHWYVLCKKNADDYGVPGGGWNKNETPEHAAIRELQEETLSNVKDVKRMGTLIEYHTKVKDWVKEHVPNKNDWWYGYYSAVFVGIYDGEYKGKVKSEDRESGYTWKPVDYKLMKEFPKEYSDAINDYINNVHFGGYIVKCESDTINKKYGYKYDQYYLLVGNKRVAEVKVLKKEKFMFDAETYKEFRRRGYMEYLVKYLVTYKGVRHLNVALDNKAAISLYKKIGFKDDGFVRGDNDEKLQRMSISESDVKNINFSLKESVDILDESISDSVAQMLPPMTSGKKESEKDIMKKFMELEEDMDFIESIANNGWESVEEFNEKSHGLLKYDFRFARNTENNKLIKIVYELNRNMKPHSSIDNHTYQRYDKTKGDYYDISRYGNKDHRTSGQKVLAIIEYDNDKDAYLTGGKSLFGDIKNNIPVKGRRLQKVKCKGLFGMADKTFDVEVGKIDNEYSYKSTHAPKKHELNAIDIATDDLIPHNLKTITASHEQDPINRGTKADKNVVISINIAKEYLNKASDKYKKINNRLKYLKGIIERIKIDKSKDNSLAVEAEKDLKEIFRDVKHRFNDIEVAFNQIHNNQILLQSNDKIKVSQGTDNARFMMTHSYPMDLKLCNQISSEIKRFFRLYPSLMKESTAYESFEYSLLTEDTEENIEDKTIDTPKETDKREKNKNGVRRKALYMGFIDFAKTYNNKNTFGSIFDKDAFTVTYPFVPHDMRYFYRLANPILCVLEGDLTFFQVSELSNMNSKNKQIDKYLIFAATENDLRVYNNDDRGVYFATSDEEGNLTIGSKLGDTFDLYIQEMIKQGDILNVK